jgi:hypothetical protein
MNFHLARLILCAVYPLFNWRPNGNAGRQPASLPDALDDLPFLKPSRRPDRRRLHKALHALRKPFYLGLIFYRLFRISPTFEE